MSAYQANTHSITRYRQLFVMFFVRITRVVFSIFEKYVIVLLKYVATTKTHHDFLCRTKLWFTFKLVSWTSLSSALIFDLGHQFIQPT